MIERRLIDGRLATVAYLSADWLPSPRGAAKLIKIIYDDGDVEFSVPQSRFDSVFEDAKKRGGNLPPAPEPEEVEQWLGEEPIEAGIYTAGDDKVCELCEDYAAGAPYDIDEVEDALPMHPNCRCTWFPWDDQRFARDAIHDVEPPDFIKDPITGQFGGSRAHGHAVHKAEWVKQSEEKREAWLAKFGKPREAVGEVKKYKNWDPSFSGPNHVGRIKTIAGKTAQISTTFRWQMKMFIEEAAKLKKEGVLTHEQAAATATICNAKIGESFYRQAQSMLQKDPGKQSEFDKLVKKAKGLGFNPDIGSSTPAVLAATAKAKKVPGWTAKEIAATPAPSETLQSANEVTNWEKVGGQLGSNPGGTYKDPSDNSQWYVKTAQSEDHLANDMLTQRLYKLAGLEVPEQRKVLRNDQPAVASRIIGKKTVQLGELSSASQQAAFTEIRKGFAVDAWLGNRDVIGLDKDNILLPESEGNEVYRVDFGGGLKYRAKGQPKEPPLGVEVSEITSMRNKAININTAEVFDMSDKQVAATIDKVLSISPGQIMSEASLLGIPEVGQTLVARREWLNQWKNHIEVKAEPPKVYTAELTGAQLAAEAMGTKTKFTPAAELKPAPKVTPAGKATAAELEKAKKSGKFYPDPTSPQGKWIVEPFNVKWATAANLTPAQLEEKVAHYKQTKAALEQHQKSEELLANTEKAKAEKAAKAAAEKAAQQAIEAKKAAEVELKHIAAELGIDENDSKSFKAFVSLAGGDITATLKQFKQFQKEGSTKGYPISPFEYAMLRSYTGSGHKAVNNELRKGVFTPTTYVFTNALNSCLKKLPLFTGNTHRGTDVPKAEKDLYETGSIFEMRSFTSSTKGDHGWGGDTQYYMKGKSGRDISSLSKIPSESECLYPARTFWRIDKMEGSPNTTLKVWCTEVDPY